MNRTDRRRRAIRTLATWAATLGTLAILNLGIPALADALAGALS